MLNIRTLGILAAFATTGAGAASHSDGGSLPNARVAKEILAELLAISAKIASNRVVEFSCSFEPR